MNGWQRNRVALSFENRETARKRKQTELDEGVQNKKKHIGDIDKMTWDKEKLKEEVEGYMDGQEVNWSELAREYNVCDNEGLLSRNGGQIVKEWLFSQNVNIDRFTTKSPNCPITRKRKRRGPGEEISMPTEVYPNVLKQQLQEKLNSGDYTIGEMIVPRKVTA